ncbi:protein-glutamate O-methyltransferase CheR [Listeria monocytogenes]|uniref:CheR family methyltransferase n=1 Tax=Listeria monocytogenes TaxID=1639 RepID=UPI0011EAA1F5|nr:protein-glutamate O-methyltransferase CheR [Listeria monocytogenes]TYU38837.1 protein-glutamate O-methyltransferase CheR [Listeria monocytogenes]
MIPDLEKDYLYFTRVVKRDLGLDLALYKETQMKRRILSFIVKKQYITFGEFFKYLKKDAVLLDEFISLITINVSSFFRNRNRWDALEKQVLPRLLENSRGKLRVWSAACSSGEEPYSLAMMMERSVGTRHYDILATDLEPAILKRAVIGEYQSRQMEELNEQERHTAFVKKGDTYQILPKYRKSIRFRRHDLLTDYYEKGFDLIVCRNVLIYFTAEGKHQAYQKFAESLRRGGVLFIGGSEQILNPADYGLATLNNFFYIKT